MYRCNGSYKNVGKQKEIKACLTDWLKFDYFRVLDANAYERKHRLLVTYLRKCTLFLVEELVCFNGDLVFAFTRATLTEYTKSSMKDQMYKVMHF